MRMLKKTLNDEVPHGQVILVMGVVGSNINILSVMIHKGCGDSHNITNRKTSCRFIFGGKRHICILQLSYIVICLQVEQEDQVIPETK